MRTRIVCQIMSASFAILVLLVIGAVSQSSDETGAKGMFYGQEYGKIPDVKETQTPPQNTLAPVKPVQTNMVKFVGLHYWIELEGAGRVTSSHLFKTGDRIKLYVRGNVDGYLSLWAISPSGRSNLLFPPSGGSTSDNFVTAGREYTIPGKIRFTPPVQDETLLVVFSRKKADIPDLKDSIIDDQTILKPLGPDGFKSLVFESENRNPSEVGDYIVNKTGGPVVRKILLKHVPR